MMRKLLYLPLVALVAAVTGACQDSSQLLRPDSQDIDASRGEGGGPAGPAPSCNVTVPDDEPTVQDGVDAAASGEKVCVKATGSPYQEQVLIAKDLTLAGLNDPVIEPPADLSAFTIVESGPTWEPIVFVYGGAVSNGTVSGSEVIEVDVQGITVNGNARQPDARRAVGIFYRNAEGIITQNTVENMAVGGKETMGILAYGDSDVRITHNTVTQYERGGIGANGDGGAHPSPNAIIANNAIDAGAGGTLGEAWAPNGVQLGFGATGRVSDNVIENNRWASSSESAFLASCVLVFESDQIKVNGNQASNCDQAIGVGAWGLLLEDATGNVIQRNTVNGAIVGVIVQAWASGWFSQLSPVVENTKVVNNRLRGGNVQNSDVGIWIEERDTSDEFDPTVLNSKVINNGISGFDERILDTGTETKNHANRPFQP